MLWKCCATMNLTLINDIFIGCNRSLIKKTESGVSLIIYVGVFLIFDQDSNTKSCINHCLL